MLIADDELNSSLRMLPNPLHEKIAELNSRLIDVAEIQWVHILINITVVDWDNYQRTMGNSTGFPTDKLMYAALWQVEHIYSSLQ